MADKKPPAKRLGRLNSEGNGDGKTRLSSLKGDGAGPSSSKPPEPTAITSRFKPKNFSKAEIAAAPEPAPAAQPEPAQRRPSYRDRKTTGARSPPTGRRTVTYESEVVFGGVVGAGGLSQTEATIAAARNIAAAAAAAAAPKKEDATSPKTTSKRLVKASGASIGGGGTGGGSGGGTEKGEGAAGPSGGGGTRTQRVSTGGSGSGGGDISSSSSEENFDSDVVIDEYYPTRLKQHKASTEPHIPEELMARPVENEALLNAELTKLTTRQLEEPGLMLFQLPSVLPIPVLHQSGGLDGGAGPSTSAAAAAGVGNSGGGGGGLDGCPASLAALPAGKIGKVLVLRSGAVKIQIGDVLFDVSPGIPCEMRQDFAAVDPVTKECIMLGQLTERIVVTPNIDNLLNSTVPEWKYAAEGDGGSGGGGGGGGIVIDDEDDDYNYNYDDDDVDAMVVDVAVRKQKKKIGGAAVLIDSDSEEDEYIEIMDVDGGDGGNGATVTTTTAAAATVEEAAVEAKDEDGMTDMIDALLPEIIAPVAAPVGRRRDPRAR